jgi:hypothetical protein
VILEIFLGMFLGLIIYLCCREPIQGPARYARHYDGDEDDDDTPRRSKRLRDEDDPFEDRRREWE